METDSDSTHDPVETVSESTTPAPNPEDEAVAAAARTLTKMRHGETNPDPMETEYESKSPTPGPQGEGSGGREAAQVLVDLFNPPSLGPLRTMTAIYKNYPWNDVQPHWTIEEEAFLRNSGTH